MQKGFGVVNLHGTASGVIALPVIGENGNWYLGNEDTGVSAIGTDGTTPHIGENGNWFIGEVDTGVKAKGEDGQPGPQGEKGEKGDTGAQGPKGDSFNLKDTIVIASQVTVSALNQNVPIPFATIHKEGLVHLENGKAVIDVSGWYMLSQTTNITESTSRQNFHDCQLYINDTAFLINSNNHPMAGVNRYSQYNMSDITYLNKGDRLSNSVFLNEAAKINSFIHITRLV